MSVTAPTLDGRYQMIARVASGGMGEVYRAHDAVLGREVAVKVLHPQLAGDRGFVDRFRREARAAAILNHPNIVGVYDWGSTDGTYFMVMEYVPGHNLRALLTEYRRMEPAQVVEVALPVLSALDHAHGHGIVHRDVKPENILIAQNGVVKVADFGLARAFADSYVSQAEGTVTGTVQYLAPEQIQGDPADPRTDLYAVGVVMFELLTGHPPFTGETSLSIAYQHLSNRVPAVSAEVPGVPPELDGVIRSATERDREARPPSARTMRDQVALAGGSAEPAPTVRSLAEQLPETAEIPPERAPTVTIPRRESPAARRRRRFRIAVTVLALLALLAGGAWALWEYVIPHYASVPNVAGMPVDQAAARLEAMGFEVSLGPAQFSSTVDSGLVIRTEPPPGTRLRTRTKVVVIPSNGPKLIAVPDVRGLAEADAKKLLSDDGFKPVVRRAYDDNVPRGQVISQNPDPNQEIREGSTVTIVVSQGPPLVAVPDVTGQPVDIATTALRNAGFKIHQTQEYSTTVPRDQVIRTVPAKGAQAPKGSTVTVVVSLGPQTFALPDVTGLRTADAQKQLEDLGLIVQVVVLPTKDPPDTVVFQSVAAGTIVKQGDTIILYVTSP